MSYNLVMRKTIYQILNNAWNGKANVITCNRCVDIDSIFNMIQKEFEKQNESCLYVRYSKDNVSSNNILHQINDLMDLLKGNRIVFLINTLSDCMYPEAIINSFYGNKNVTAIITTDISIEYYLKDKDTQIRGRYNSYFYVPQLYDEIATTSNFHLDPLQRFSSPNEAAKLYQYILNRSGEVLSFRSIYEAGVVYKSLPFYIEAIIYMINSGMLYCLNRVDIKEGKALFSGVVFYPTFISDLEISDIPFEKKSRVKNEAFLVAKMISEGYSIDRAISHFVEVNASEKRIRVEFNRGFLITHHDRQCVIKIDNNNVEEMERFKKSKRNIPHMIAVPGKMELRIDKDGVAYCGLVNLLTKGLNGYGGF